MGAALHCSSGAVVHGHDLHLDDGSALAGGAVSALDGCDLVLTDSSLSSSVAFAGGLMAVGDATASLWNVAFFNGRADVGGALAVGDLWGDGSFGRSEVSCWGCVFGQNEADYGGAFYGHYNSVTQFHRGRLTNNTATFPNAGGAAYLLGATPTGCAPPWTSTTCSSAATPTPRPLATW